MTVKQICAPAVVGRMHASARRRTDLSPPAAPLISLPVPREYHLASPRVLRTNELAFVIQAGDLGKDPRKDRRILSRGHCFLFVTENADRHFNVNVTYSICQLERRGKNA